MQAPTLRIAGLSIEQWTAVTNVLLTIGLLLFAGMQWWVTKRSEAARRRERAADEQARDREADRALDAAFQLVWAEHFRLDGLADQWDREDLVVLSALGVLSPDDVLPRDWTVVIRAVSQLSVESGFLGGVAMTRAHDMARSIASLNGVVQGIARQYPQHAPAHIIQVAHSSYRGETDPIVRAIRHGTRDLSLLLWDAARQSPRADLDREMNFRDDMRSESGRVAIGALKAREAEAPIALPDNAPIGRGGAG